MEIVIGKDNKCTCYSGDKCALGKKKHRCSKKELKKLGYNTYKIPILNNTDETINVRAGVLTMLVIAILLLFWYIITTFDIVSTILIYVVGGLMIVGLIVAIFIGIKEGLKNKT